jgi:Cu(I)/Ag(I) efflux system membrane protein CusA/SilA
MWSFAALLLLAAGMFPLQAIIGQGASETAWKTAFLATFFVVTSLTVISITGKSGSIIGDLGYVLLAAVLFVAFGGLWWSRAQFVEPLFARAATTVTPSIVNSVLLFLARLVTATVALGPIIVLFVMAFRVDRVVIWRSLSLVTLTLLALWSYHFPKIGVAFMPALDEGTTLDMPVTVPRASVTQAADDLKARDALLRGFPEVESVIGKAGRADTPTDPAPLDMVETFVNFRPKELWPKRVLRYPDAAQQVTLILDRLIGDKLVSAVSDDDRRNLINDATQKAIERFDEAMRELALRRYVEFEYELEKVLTQFSVKEAVRSIRRNTPVSFSDQQNETDALSSISEDLTTQFGPWLSRQPALEDATRLSQAVASALKERGVIAADVDALQVRESTVQSAVSATVVMLGGEQKTFATELLEAIERRRDELWHEHVRQVNWELFDRGVESFTWYALEETVRAADGAALLDKVERGAEAQRFAKESLRVQLGKPADLDAMKPFHALREELEEPMRKRVFFWQRRTGPKGDLVDDEMSRVLQVPGWSNIFTQPIINRIEMLSTGVRTDIGVKVFGPDLPTIDRVCKQIEAALKPINGARDVIAAPIMGKGYIDIQVNREEAARYGISVEDVQNEIETALAGKAVTFTVEKRDRFPVRLRYARASREDEDSIRRLLISPRGMSTTTGSTGAMSPSGMATSSSKSRVTFTGTAHLAAPGHAAQQNPLIPLSAVADVSVVEGPAMIKSENGQLLNYVTLNVRGRDIVGFVEQAKRAVAQKVKLPEGVSIGWSGEFEHQVRAAQTLRFVFPAVIVLIFVILYLTYNDLADAALMMLAVPEALAGGAFFMYFFPKIMQGWDAPPMDFSVAVWVGFIACFGMATETGIIMLVYLREAIEKRGGLENIRSLEELRQAVIEGAVHRLRPKLLTEGVAIIAIFPMVFNTGVGGEILAPMALPVLGGLLISDEVVDLFLPVRFYWVRRVRWLKLQEARRRDQGSSNLQESEAPAIAGIAT